MITRISKKEYDLTQARRKTSQLLHGKQGYMVFKGADGHYYKCDKSGMAGVKEMVEFNKNFKHGIDSQTSLI